ncbi:hypothetical protein TNCV_2266251 [Trichonephila clavipes]|nr:hypothetical protein TNCV_2266251 [Trichonephila clavipes]
MFIEPLGYDSVEMAWCFALFKNEVTRRMPEIKKWELIIARDIVQSHLYFKIAKHDKTSPIFSVDQEPVRRSFTWFFAEDKVRRSQKIVQNL